jgi:parvulin-like peptidyl-prolyl isomerase
MTEEQITQYFEVNQDQFGPKPEVRARHVLIRVAPEMDEFARAEAKQRAEEVLEKARQGQDFAELANQYTEDPTGNQNGGDLGWFGRGSMVAAFDSAAFVLKPGELSGLVLTQFGYHVIKVEETRMTEARELEQVRGLIEQQIHQERFKDAVFQLRTAGEVQINPPSQETIEAISS